MRRLFWLCVMTSLGLGLSAKADDRPDWVRKVTRMAFATPGQVEQLAKDRVQVLHTNLVWPHYPLKKDGGGLKADDAKALKVLADSCHRHGIRLILGLPPFPSVANIQAHPEWRVHHDPAGKTPTMVPKEDDLGTRLGCNVGPWGDYLIDVLVELTRDYGIDGYSFDGNYHPSICYCPACRAAYRADRNSEVPAKVDLDDIAYRTYLIWRGERLESHYREMKRRLREVNPDAAIMTWTVNAGRYGHLLSSPRSMSTAMNRAIDLPMQEWWLDETNLGGSIASTFGVAYLAGLGRGGPVASEPYLMSRGNPYGTDSFPRLERFARMYLAMTHGNLAPQSYGWAGHEAETSDVFRAMAEREPWLTETRPIPWAAMVVGESTRQFVAHKDIAARYLPHPFGAFRALIEEHRPVQLIGEHDLNAETLAPFRVLILPNVVALSDRQVGAIREFVRDGGGLVATSETSLADELGRPRKDFALADVFGVSYQGRVASSTTKESLDVNFLKAIDDSYWARRTGVARLNWSSHPLVKDDRLKSLVPKPPVVFRGPLLRVTEPKASEEVAVRFTPDGSTMKDLPGAIVRTFGKGRVAYIPIALDAALWDYAYPYQRRLFVRAVDQVAASPAPWQVDGPMGVQVTGFEQESGGSTRRIFHLYNGIDTTARHGKPGTEVPLREETVAVHGLKLRLHGQVGPAFAEPGHEKLHQTFDAGESIIAIPPLDLHRIVVIEGR